MKRLTIFVLALVFILMLSGCNRHSQGGQDMAPNSTEIDSVTQMPEDDYVVDTISDGEKENDTITVCPSNLTLQTLQDLVNRCGENLTWDDFSPYYNTGDIGSGLYILRYPIDWDYYLLIGGSSMDLPPMYIDLVSGHDIKNYIDVRFDNIDNFISNTPKLSDFSYKEILETYKKDVPGVKVSGFNNTSRVAIETLTDVLVQAEEECTVEYDTTDISYDNATSIWQVAFYKANSAGGGQTIYMDNYGVTCLVVYGE